MQRFHLFLILLSVIASSVMAQDADQVLSVWPKSPPQWTPPTESERDTSGADGRPVAGKPVIRLGFVSTPQVHVYRPAENDTSTAVVICPGGGFSILAWDLEGTEIAQWFQSIGVTAIVLKYRVPTREADPRWKAPVQDVQRAISMIRAGTIEGVRPSRVGVLGFSAGGNTAAHAALASERHYDAVDSVDGASCTPDFAVLVYPAWLVQEDDSSQLIDTLAVDENSPPMFLAHAADDRIDAASSVTMFTTLKQHGVASSLHVFATGGHGFGGRIAGAPTDAWRGLCESWMKSKGWLAP
ncbi:Acetylxylan esterase precursor [Rubripirellula tenax]|uniref:Acetylxylan esterase n=1 Tax=Rubripirellula tenax TaxID=2528015 RepID=A0A5C6FFD2_9BACT|nr:alpha/beta hydrolase [Rubripirellula tenax]TWU60516.1 Acetylxylan esterase precursor [Rubripirellula tenax]